MVETEAAALMEFAPGFPEAETEFGRLKLEFDSEGGVRVVEKYFQDLDIGIRRGAGKVLVTVETVDNGEFKDLYWHQDPGNNPRVEAVMTEENQEIYYGDLRYSKDGQNWSKTISVEPCRFIQFKAKEKAGNQANHKFSYNVRLPRISGYLEVDPDIQNPKVN
jgi:hypothetical protein